MASYTNNLYTLAKFCERSKELQSYYDKENKKHKRTTRTFIDFNG